jgi:phosphoenolpyruvate synthase/pyruvate phosphate dikinase
VPHRAHVLRSTRAQNQSDARDDRRRQSRSQRKEALDKLLPYQREDFIGMFTAMNGKPVTIRLLDPPLHEFLPHSEDQAVSDLASPPASRSSTSCVAASRDAARARIRCWVIAAAD